MSAQGADAAWEPVRVEDDDDDVGYLGDPALLFDAIAALLARPAWQVQARCRGAGTTAFFPLRGMSDADAIALCAACSVTASCLADALSRPEAVDLGVWGGTNAFQRRGLRRQLRLESA